MFRVAARIHRKAHHSRSSRYQLGALNLKFALFCVKFAAFIKAIPFELCSPHQLQVKLFHETWKRWLWYFVNMAVYTNAAFQIISFGWSVRMYGMTNETAFHVIYLVFGVLPILHYSNALLKPHELVKLINQINFLMRIRTGKFLR